MAAVKFVGWIQKFLRSSPCCVGSQRVSGPLPWVAAAAMMGVAMVAKDEEDFAVMLILQYVAYLRPSELCNLTVGQVFQPLQGSGEQCALLSAPQEELKALKTAEFDESVLLDGHLSVALGKALTRYTAGKTAATQLWSRSQARYAEDFVQCAEAAGVNVITTSLLLGSSRRSVVRCALANPIVEVQKRGRWRSEKSVRRHEEHTQLLKEISKLSDATPKCGQLVMSRMSRLLSGALSPPSPVLTRLVRNHA